VDGSGAIERVVATTTLDELLREQGACPAVVKMDVEGHEAAVMRGFASALRSLRPVIVLESAFQGDTGPLERQLADSAYLLFAIDESRPALTPVAGLHRAPEPTPGNRNYLLAPDEFAGLTEVLERAQAAISATASGR
jgi:hypothetical protein